ncbi:MAG: sulfotransferase family 2 domain-containing protein [Pseudomonadota bacterium]
MSPRDPIKEFVSKISEMGRSARSQYRTGQISAREAANKIKFFGSDLGNAVELVLEELERAPTRELRELLGEFHVNLGKDVIAKSLFRDCYFSDGHVHVTNLIYADIDAVAGMVDDTHKVLYIPIPKCGSSTIKNFFSMLLFNETHGEMVHFKNPSLNRVLTPGALQTTYRDYFKFAVIRDPIKRVTSYFTSNVSNRALRREALGRDRFFDLTTMPGPVQVAARFHDYRQMFIDFRHHTDPIDGYLSAFARHLDKVYVLNEMDGLRARLEDIYEMKIEDEKFMVTQAVDEEVKRLCAREFEKLQSFYDCDNRYF